MTDRPILYSAPMMRACLDGRKTQTRRALAEQPPAGQRPVRVLRHPEGAPSFHAFEWRSLHNAYLRDVKVRFAVGDRLWVREAWRCNGWATDVATIFYRASEGDGYTAMCEQYPVLDRRPLRVTGSWRPGIHMPRWASRLTQVVTKVRIERLQDISDEDAIAEGVEPFGNGAAFVQLKDAQTYSTPRGCYAALWDSINGAGAWAANPWVAAVTFTNHHRNIDALEAQETA